MEGLECVTGNVAVKLCQDDTDLLRPHSLTVPNEIDDLADLPDVGAVLERSGILDSTADGSSPSSLKCFDFAVEDSNSGLPFDGILDLPDGTSSALPQNLPPPPSGGIFCLNGQGLQPLPYLSHIPLASVVQKQDLGILDGSYPFSTNLPPVPRLVINQGIVSTTCSQKPDGGSKFVSTILSGSDDNRKLGSRSRNGKNRPADGFGLTFPNDKDAPEYRRVMDILTEYRVQVVEKSAEALMPCKRRKSRPLVDAVEIAKSGSTTSSQSGVVSSAKHSPGKHVAPLPSQQRGHVIDQPGDLSSSDSLASSGSATDLPRVFDQNTLGIISENSPHVLVSKPVTGRALDVVVPQTVVSDGLSYNKLSSILSGGPWKEVIQKHRKLLFTVSCSESSTANTSSSESIETCVKSSKKALEPSPKCRCFADGRYQYNSFFSVNFAL